MGTAVLLLDVSNVGNAKLAQTSILVLDWRSQLADVELSANIQISTLS